MDRKTSMNDIHNWIPALGICAIIIAVGVLMIVASLNEIKDQLSARLDEDRRLNDLTEQVLRSKIKG